MLFTNVKLFAQSEKGHINFVIQPQVLIPTSKIKETNGISFGGYISYENPITEKYRLLISFGGGLF